jgi:hypothetical protein
VVVMRLLDGPVWLPKSKLIEAAVKSSHAISFQPLCSPVIK